MESRIQIQTGISHFQIVNNRNGTLQNILKKTLKERNNTSLNDAPAYDIPCRHHLLQICKIAKSHLKKQISKLTVLRVCGAQKTACTPA